MVVWVFISALLVTMFVVVALSSGLGGGKTTNDLLLPDSVIRRTGYYSQDMNLFKSILHNIGVLIVGLGLAFLGKRVDSFFGIRVFHSIFATSLAWLLLGIGFLVRVWATFYFYERRMKVISLAPQRTLITSGPYRFSRNPLYLGGNVFIFFGAALLFGSPTALFMTAIHLPFIDLFIRREEKQLEKDFGEEWVRYKKQVRRWI